MILRDYQEEIKGRLYAAWDAGCRSVMCQMPTGTGKTVVLAQVIKEQILGPSQSLRDSSPSKGSGCRDERGCRVLVVAHRKEILEQIRETLGKHGLEYSIADGSIIVESIQKLTNKKSTSFLSLLTGEDAQRAGEGLLVIIDEAHHCTAKTYRMMWEAFPEAKFLGMTATPCRLKQEGFTELFDRLVTSWQVSKFINEGWLALFDYVAVKPDGEMLKRVRSLKKRSVDGDYQMKEMGTVMDNRASIEQLYRSYKKYAEGKQGIIYAINKEHAGHIASFYEEMMLCEVKSEELKVKSAIAVVDSATPKKERERINKEYREGKIRILVNCDIYSEGYDAPFVEFIQLARPTLSLSKYLQQVGRGLRPNEGKKKTVILDNVGLYYMFGLPNEDRDWTRMFREGQIMHDMKRVGDIEEVAYFYRTDIIDNKAHFDGGHDNEMVVVMKHDELAQQAEEDNAGYEVFRVSSGFYGIKKGEKVCVDACYQEIGEITDGYAIAHYCGEKCVINMKGRKVYCNPGITKLHRNGIAEFRTSKGNAAYYDLKTGIKYEGCALPPEVVMVDFVEFVCFDDEFVLRVPCGEYFRFTREDMVVRGNVFQRRDRRTGVSVFVHRSRPKEIYMLIGYDNEYRKALHKIDYERVSEITDKPNPLYGVCFYKDGEFTYKYDSVTCTRWDVVNRKVNAKWYAMLHEENKVRMQRRQKSEESVRREALITAEGSSASKEAIAAVPIRLWTKNRNIIPSAVM